MLLLYLYIYIIVSSGIVFNLSLLTIIMNKEIKEYLVNGTESNVKQSSRESFHLQLSVFSETEYLIQGKLLKKILFLNRTKCK